MDAKQVWRAALGELQVTLSPANFETWLRDTALVEVDDTRFRISVPNGFAKDWLESRYRSLISQTLGRIVGYGVQVDFVVGASGADGVDAGAGAGDSAGASTAAGADGSIEGGGSEAVGADLLARAPRPRRHEPPRAIAPGAGGAGRVGGEGGATNINPRYTFANFIVGSANRLAHAASLSVAERPGHAYNPLFLYGGVGLGKTHLMHAIGNQVMAKFPRKRVVYATSEKFTNEFITSIQQGKIDDFRARYRRIDLLLIDDIQFIADKERTQEEFFHTFNAIHEDGKQIVLSSDRPPKAILTLEERLRSRFEWGLIADLTAPDLETRIAILRAKAEEGAVPISSDVIEFIARKVVSNIRELEGALNRIVAYASMGAMPISIELAQAVLSNVLYNPKKRQITPERIAKAVSEYYGVALEQLKGQKRDKAIVVPRQIAMFLMREETDVSLLRIGAELGEPGPLHGAPRVRQDHPRVGGQRRAAARDRRRPRADLRRLTARGPVPGAPPDCPRSVRPTVGTRCTRNDPGLIRNVDAMSDNRGAGRGRTTARRDGSGAPAGPIDPPRIPTAIPALVSVVHGGGPGINGPPNGGERGRPPVPHHDDGDDGPRKIEEDTHTERRDFAGAGSPARRRHTFIDSPAPALGGPDVKLSVMQENLARGLGVVSRAVSNRSTLPVLANVLLKTEDGGLRLTTTNLEIGLIYWVPGKVETDGVDDRARPPPLGPRELAARRPAHRPGDRRQRDAPRQRRPVPVARQGHRRGRVPVHPADRRAAHHADRAERAQARARGDRLRRRD